VATALVETQELAGQIRTMFVVPVLPVAVKETLGDHDDLLAVLDSLHLLRMVMALESHFGIKLEHSDMTAENLGSIARLASLVAQKCKPTNQ
jgi:acyl carrier protein